MATTVVAKLQDKIVPPKVPRVPFERATARKSRKLSNLREESRKFRGFRADLRVGTTELFRADLIWQLFGFQIKALGDGLSIVLVNPASRPVQIPIHRGFSDA